MTSINPWNLEAIEQYRFYCCIECDMKLKESQDFVDHVLLTHAESFRIQTQNNFILDLKVTDSEQVCVVPSIKKKCQQIEKDSVVQLQKLTESKILYHTSPKKDLKDEELFILSEAEDSLDQDQEDNNDHPEWTENELETIGDDVEFKSTETESINESSDLHDKPNIVRRTRNRCKLCKIQFELKSEYNDHIEDTHKVENGYNCSICQKILPSKRKWMVHVVKEEEREKKQTKNVETQISIFGEKKEQELTYKIEVQQNISKLVDEEKKEQGLKKVKQNISKLVENSTWSNLVDKRLVMFDILLMISGHCVNITTKVHYHDLIFGHK